MSSLENDKKSEKSQLPLLTIGIISFNRFHYLKATLESARQCIKYPRIQWIISDASVEPGLQDYLQSQDWIDQLLLHDKATRHVDAMNEIVERAEGDVILLWPDDEQFIVEGDWMIDCVEILVDNPWIGSMCLDCHYLPTFPRLWNWQRWLNWKGWAGEIKNYRGSFRRQKKIHSSRGLKFRTFGWVKPGIVGSGIPSLTRTEVWRELGPWIAPGAAPGLVDSSGGGETEMLQRFKKSGLILQRALPIVPVAADIVNDPTGTKAKVRGNKRYGVYNAPPEGSFYYRIYKQDEVSHLDSRRMPLSFEEFVKPIGFTLPLDDDGNLLRNPINIAVVTSLNS